MVELRSDIADYTASTGLCWLLLRYLQRQGVALCNLRLAPKLELEQLIAPASRVSLLDLERLWTWAATLVPGGQPLGIRVAETMVPSAPESWPMPFALLESIGRFSQTLQEGLQRQLPFMRLLCDGLSVKVEDWTRDRLLISWEHALPRFVPHDLNDFHLAATLVLLRRIIGEKAVVPVETWITRNEPKNALAYRVFFGPTLRFRASQPALVVSIAATQDLLPSHDPVMLQAMEHHGHALLCRLPRLPDFLLDVREHIEAELPNGKPTADRIAERFRLSSRSLHRRLHLQETTFQRQLDHVRYKLAMKYLAAECYDLREIAWLLGFTDHRKFQRAFSRWAGQSPGAYRWSVRAATSASI